MPYADLKTISLATTVAAADRFPFGDVSADAWGGISYSDLLAQILGQVPATTPGGSDTQLQYNNAGAFGGVSGFTWDAGNSRLVVASARVGVGVAVPVAQLHVVSQTGLLVSAIIDGPAGDLVDILRVRDAAQQNVVKVTPTKLVVCQPDGISGTNELQIDCLSANAHMVTPAGGLVVTPTTALIVRQPGGTSGVDETQYYQDANGGWAVEKSGTRFNITTGGALVIGSNPAAPSNTGWAYFAGNRLRLDTNVVLGWCAADAVSGDLDTSLSRDSAGVLRLAGQLNVQQVGGTAGVDEVQISHDGTTGKIVSGDGGGGLIVNWQAATALDFVPSSGGTGLVRIFGSNLELINGNLRLPDGSKVVTWDDAGLARSAAGVVKVTDGSTGYGSLQLSAGTLMGLSSTSAARERASFEAAAIDNTDASRKYRWTLSAWDTAERECVRGWADGADGRVSLAAPTSSDDTNLPVGQISFYRVEGSNELRVRVKYGDGTVKEGFLALS